MAELTSMPFQPKWLQLQGISARQIREHFEILYRGYVATVNRIRTDLRTVSRENVNPRYSSYREMKVEETFNLDGVILHELYFENLTAPGEQPAPALRQAIETDFGSFDAWEKDFRAAAAASRGWAMLAYDYRSGALHNFLADAHNVGIVQSSYPLLLIDVYEHAYFIDYGANRGPYINAFFQNIDWTVVLRRYQQLRRLLEAGTRRQQ
ncbi:superoxide dismutase [Heliophilum fasciatum]|uniref:superoxide dismutase n=1 Tax=Heliophilum fasciatum TaxID=35700 RepID=A0A4R2RYG9_9FIRM|nr:Fe-Mn family superoxide dismutase [Heliophilum fasciatum]MCW2276897.1 Fe-Mn family superoxide dismutase [Heliophilum fasciatum]TCP68643.1 Fe-Mn family superoxide dismutase [Heliophilum fasciatum]